MKNQLRDRPSRARRGSAALCLISFFAAAALAGCGGDSADRADEPLEDAGSATVAATPPGSATGTASPDADLRDIAEYELTMERVDRFFAANRNIATAVSRMSPAEVERMEGALDLGGSGSVDDYVAEVQRHPPIRQAIEGAGLSPREFAVLMLAMIQAGMAQAVIDAQPAANADSLAREMRTNSRNVRFIRENAAAIQQRQQAFQAELERLGVDQ